MAIKIAAWNVEGRLSAGAGDGRGSPAHIVRTIEALNADVLVLPEAFMDGLDKMASQKFAEIGYDTYSTAYEDINRQKSKHFFGSMHMALLSRLPLKNVEYIRPGGVRTLIACQVVEPATNKPLRIIATHLDDRSEVLRVRQVKELTRYINGSKLPVVMLGDFNAMWPTGRAVLLGSKVSRVAASLLPHAQLRGVARRAVEMAEGKALGLLTEATGLVEADAHHRATATPKRYGSLWLPSIRLLPIDHLLVSPDVRCAGYKVGKDGGSDHRPISATVSL